MFSGGAPRKNPYKKVKEDVDTVPDFTDPTGGAGQEIRTLKTPDNGGMPSEHAGG